MKRLWKLKFLVGVWQITLLIITTLIQLLTADIARILLLPSVPQKSTWMPNLGKELIKQDYEVYAVVRKEWAHAIAYQNNGMKLITYQINISSDITLEKYEEKWSKFINSVTKEATTSHIDAQIYLLRTRSGADILAGDGESLLKNNQFWEHVKQLKFNLAVIEGNLLTPYLYIIPYKLGIPFVSSAATWDEYRMRLPFLPSFSPAPLLPLTDEMTFPQRLKNFVFAILSPQIETSSFISSDNLLKKYASEKPAISTRDLQRISKLWIVDAAPPVEYPRITLSNIVITGGLTIETPQLLDSSLEGWIRGSDSDIVIVRTESFAYSEIPDNIHQLFITAFYDIPDRVIYVSKDEVKTNIPKNVKVVADESLSTLLSINEVKLFVSSCSTSALYESVFHGVPLICIPLFGEQHYNSRKVQAKGYGMVMEMYSFKSKQLTESIQAVISTPQYKENILRASAILKTEPLLPIEKAAFWVDHVIQYGADHLNSRATDLPWYSLYSVDVAAFFFLMVLLAATVCVVTTYRLTCRVYRFFELDKDKIE